MNIFNVYYDCTRLNQHVLILTLRDMTCHLVLHIRHQRHLVMSDEEQSCIDAWLKSHSLLHAAYRRTVKQNGFDFIIQTYGM